MKSATGGMLHEEDALRGSSWQPMVEDLQLHGPPHFSVRRNKLRAKFNVLCTMSTV